MIQKHLLAVKHLQLNRDCDSLSSLLFQNIEKRSDHAHNLDEISREL